MRILVVEDDNLIAQSLVKNLTYQHYNVDVATDGQAGWEFLDCYTYDLILLDVMLPKVDGISLCRRLREQGNKTPILLLTAQDNSTNKVVGLDAGADDYLSKPFDFQELLARIRALLRRGGSALPPLLKWHNLQLDPSICEVTSNGQVLHLTPKEYSLLELLLRNPHRIFSCSALIDQLWSLEETPTDETVRSHIKGLRQKLKAGGVKNDPIDTVYGIGYRLKAEFKEEDKIKPEKSNIKNDTQPRETQIQNPKSKIQNVSIARGVSQVWDEVSENLSQRVKSIEEAKSLLVKNKLSEELRLKAKQEAHKLVGSLGMFDSDEGSVVARKIEGLLEIDQKLSPTQIKQFSKLVTQLRQELQRMGSNQVTELLSSDSVSHETPLLWIVDPDNELTESLVSLATSRGIQVKVSSDPIAAVSLIATSRPDVVLLDLSVAEQAENAISMLAELAHRTPPVPVIVFTAQDSLIDRVKIIRLGGRAAFKKPVSPAQVLESVTQILQISRPNAEARVMVVDDDPQILTAVQQILTPWNIKVFTLDNPLHFLDFLEIASPDLLILDVEMPSVNGIELCQVIRNDPRWSGLPILFLTAHKNAKIRQQIFTAGADDYVSKPIVKAELVTRILNRLERTRLLRSLVEIDVLTGVSNRRKFTQELTHLFEWSQRYHQPLCLAILKLEQLKKINQQYGYAVGDSALSRFGELLRRTFQNKDAIGRWSGSEFVVCMAGINKTDGIQMLTDFRKNLHQLEFTVNHKKLHLSFTAGIVQYPEDGSDIETLYQAASN